MSTSVPDTVLRVKDQEKEEEKPGASEQTPKPLDTRAGSSETPRDAPLTPSPAVVTTNGGEELSQQNQQQKKEETSLTVPDVEHKPTRTDGKSKSAASTRSKNSSLTKSLSNGKIFTRKVNGDNSKREAPVLGTAASGSGGDESGLKAKKKKKKRTLWRFVSSCFTPSISHTILDEGSVKSASTGGAGGANKTAEPAGASAVLSEKKAGDHAVESSGSATLGSTGKPPTPSRRSSALAATGDGDLVVPPTAPDLLPLADTEGVTSGAVQAPGSTGLEGEDSESSVVDEERHRPMEEEDDEERLIMNGGNGIPIGPVCGHLTLFAAIF
jgi:RNA polymerase II subunit A small phosphatase-like protein